MGGVGKREISKLVGGAITCVCHSNCACAQQFRGTRHHIVKMSCSVAVEPQPSASDLPPVVYTTVIPFTNYSQWERRSKAPEAIKKAVSGKTKTKPKALAISGKNITHCHKHTTTTEKPVIINSRPQDDGKKLGSSVKTRTTSGTQSRSESATRLRLLRVSDPYILVMLLVVVFVCTDGSSYHKSLCG